ncbi:MAG: NAD-dependent epimerase/dehydratase family protein [Candidatus Lokiarchaeota archaeon]|nr:NAD-dependent epimerase/dehydratase family protein [Candidatus Lokiarchaeota archaeon]
MAQKTLLITGTDGFIGKYLKNYFKDLGNKVIGTVYIDKSGEDEVKVDVRNREEFDEIPDIKYDVIIHTAGIVDQRAPKKLIFDVNAEGTKNLLDWIGDDKCEHLIQMSSTAVYGFKLLGENRCEETKKCRWIGIPYMKSKAKAERYIINSDVKYTLLRMPPVLGENDSYISPTIIPRLLNGTFFFCGKKDSLYSTFYVKNLGPIVEKFIKIGPKNIAVNCTDYEITWNEYIEEYAKQLGVEVIDQKKSIFSVFWNWKNKHYLLMLSYSKFGAHYPNDKMKEFINFQPKYSWREGVKEAVEAYLKNSDMPS